MKPIRATFHYTVDVKVDASNPDHAEFFGLEYAEEKRMSHGYITDILELKDAHTVRLLSGIRDDGKGSTYSDYRDEISGSSGVYVIFWEDRGNHYKMRVEDYNAFTVSNSEMKNYVNSSYTA